jgi:hypothetical protein
MHRHRGTRALAAFILAWFVAVATELPLLHACAVHGTAASASAEQHGPAHHGALDSNTHETPGDHAACSCMGDCSAGGFSVGLWSPEHRFSVAPARDAGVVFFEADAARLPAPAFLLPYANGPPGTSVVA